MGISFTKESYVREYSTPNACPPGEYAAPTDKNPTALDLARDIHTKATNVFLEANHSEGTVLN